MNKKLIGSIGILLLSILSIYFLWRQTIVLSILLILIAFAKHKLFPITQELLWFMLIFAGGGVVEILLVNFANAWSYATSQLFGIPIWMPLFWGVVGTTIIVIYDGFSKRD